MKVSPQWKYKRGHKILHMRGMFCCPMNSQKGLRHGTKAMICKRKTRQTIFLYNGKLFAVQEIEVKKWTFIKLNSCFEKDNTT